jgi:hypothetical protein
MLDGWAWCGYHRYVGKRPSAGDIAVVMAELGRRGAAAKNGAMTPGERRELAKKAAAARWGKNGTAAALATETELAESTSQTPKNPQLFRDGADQRNHERNLRRQERRLGKA